MNTLPKAVRRLLLLIALTAGLSLLYGLQYYLGGPLRLAVVSEIHDLALSPDGSLVAAAAHDGTVRLWDIPKGRGAGSQDGWTMRELSGHTGPVVSVAFDRKGSTLFSASRDGTIRLWDISAVLALSGDEGLNAGVENSQVGTVLDVPGDQSLNNASLAADGSTLATIGEDGIVHVWDVATEELLQSIGPQENTKRAIALSPGGDLVAAGDGANIQIWNAHTGEPVQRLEGYWDDETTQEEWLGHEKEVTALAFSPDGELLVSGSADKTIVFWDLESGQVRWTGKGHFGTVTKLVFNQQGNALLSGSADSKAKGWRVPGGKVSGTYVGHLSAVNGVAFGPDPDTILSVGDDGTLRVWNVVNEAEFHIEWTAKGLQPVWGKYLSIWLLASGLLGLVCLWGLWRVRGWSHLLALALYILGPIVVLGLPLLEVAPFPPRRVTLDILMGLGSLACFILVLIKLFRNEGVLRGIAGIFVPFYAFIWGWVKAIELQIERIMLSWTSLFGIGVILRLVAGGYPQDFLSVPLNGYSLAVRLQITWPLMTLAVWYVGLVFVLTRESVATLYEAPRSAPLAEQLMASIRTRQIRSGLLVSAVWVLLLVILYSVLRRFNLDTSFMGHFLGYIMEGAKLTAGVSAASILLATILALLGALGRLSNNPIANGVSGFYISLIRGTPLLVQIYIWYLGLPRLGLILRAEQAGILALGVNYGAYMTEIFRAGIQAIGIGQHEAAQALGMSRTQTLRRIVLPQAFRIVIPPIGNEFIAMMKDSSLVSIMGVVELTFRAEKMGRRYFRSMETFIIAAAFYWILTVIFQFLQGKLETYMARGERR